MRIATLAAMGFAERAYSRRGHDEGSPFAAMAAWSVTTWLMVVLVVVFLFDAMLTPQHPYPVVFTPDTMQDLGEQIASGEYIVRTFGPLTRFGHFSTTSTVVHGRQWWRVLTFQFMHPDVWPVTLNLLCLYGFGRVMEEQLGQRRFAGLYFVCALAAPATYLVLQRTGVADLSPWAPLTGATAGVLGLLAAATWIGPNENVSLWSTGISIPRRTLALLTCAFVALIAIKRDVAGEGVAHVGGAVAGLLAAPLVRLSVRGSV
jgi:membrane associated rhomboid family serine protease